MRVTNAMISPTAHCEADGTDVPWEGGKGVWEGGMTLVGRPWCGFTAKFAFSHGAIARRALSTRGCQANISSPGTRSLMRWTNEHYHAHVKIVIFSWWPDIDRCKRQAQKVGTPTNLNHEPSCLGSWHCFQQADSIRHALSSSKAQSWWQSAVSRKPVHT